MDSEKLTRKYYSKIITLPSTKILLPLASVESIAVVIRSLIVGFDLLYSFLIYAVAISLIFWNKYRSTLFFFSFFPIIYIIFSFFGKVYLFTFGTLVPLTNYAMLIDHRDITAVGLSTLIAILPTLIYPNFWFILFPIVVGVLSFLYISSINRKGRKIMGISSMSVLRPFLRAISYKKDNEVESFLSKISIPSLLNVMVLRLNDIYIILPQIHFGLYGKVGSSFFPYLFEESLPKSFVFHGPGSHEIDLPSLKETKKVVEEILSNIKNMEKISFGEIETEEFDGFRATSIIFDNISLSFLERPNGGIDDLPGSLWTTMVERKDFIVDCHNQTLKKEIGRKERDEIRNFLGRKVKFGGNKLRIGYAEGKLEGCEGYCNEKIKVLTFISENKKTSIVYVFANNACEGVREKIRENASDLTDAILVTPDDHTCTASSLGNLYQPATLCPKLITESRRLIEESLNNALEVNDAEFKMIKIKTRVLGKVISSLTEGLEKVGSYAIKTVWIPIALPYLVLALFLIAETFIKI
ncbi:membrane protein [Candidatus Acidianus copahuensis]|uniref:Membrane protein n=1 Tax=Candidatus Acidianus copahuensis TaxID=1160895 RepID=A0A031LS02_9CREN|nr:DUF2070 family protein [Candidatus Acidianus copahuensis]EZQ11142.1 membrane protein [Candidatus Acidianus copahuensis]